MYKAATVYDVQLKTRFEIAFTTSEFLKALIIEPNMCVAYVQYTFAIVL